MRKARELDLIVKKRNGYHLSALGEIILDKMRSIIDLDPSRLMLKTIDALDDEELRLQAIHQFFNQSPDIERTLSRRP
jgi:hypothetical protein